MHKLSEMSNREFVLIIAVCATLIALAGIGAFVYISSYETQVKIAQQIEVEKAKIEKEASVEKTKIEKETDLAKSKTQEQEATKRTQERFSIFFWNGKK